MEITNDWLALSVMESKSCYGMAWNTESKNCTKYGMGHQIKKLHQVWHERIAPSNNENVVLYIHYCAMTFLGWGMLKYCDNKICAYVE
jgi:hypothetical protein